MVCPILHFGHLEADLIHLTYTQFQIESQICYGRGQVEHKETECMTLET